MFHQLFDYSSFEQCILTYRDGAKSVHHTYRFVSEKVKEEWVNAVRCAKLRLGEAAVTSDCLMRLLSPLKKFLSCLLNKSAHLMYPYYALHQMHCYGWFDIILNLCCTHPFKVTPDHQ